MWAGAESDLAADSELSGADRALEFLYGQGANPYGESTERRGGLGASMPHVPRWLGDIRRYFPQDEVSFMEKDAIERKGLKQLLLEPEVLLSLH